jgi:hypothetical protein
MIALQPVIRLEGIFLMHLGLSGHDDELGKTSSPRCMNIFSRPELYGDAYGSCSTRQEILET